MSYTDQFSLLSPEAPNLLETTAGVFGTSDSPIDFSFGGTSDLPDGSINPEDFAAFPSQMFDEGILFPGAAVTVFNPQTKKKVVVIARHAKSDESTGMDLAPHAILELGPSPNKKYVLDLNPVRGYPVADYPQQKMSEGGATAEAIVDEQPAGNLSEISMGEEGGDAPSGGTEKISSSQPDGIKSKNEDGSITYNDGITLYPDGHYEHPVNRGKDIAVWMPGATKPTFRSATNKEEKDDETDAEIGKAIMDGTQPPDLKGLYRHSAGIKRYLHKNGYDHSAAMLDWQAAQKHISSLEGPQQLRMRQAIDNAFHSLDVIEDLSNKWDAGRFPLLNKGRLLLAKQGALGPEAQQIATQLEAQISDVTSELGNVYMGGNSPTDHSLQLASKNLSAEWSKDTLKAALGMARKNLVIRDNSIKNAGVSLGSDNRYIKKEGESKSGAGEGGAPDPSKTPEPSRVPVPAPQEAEAAARRILAKDPNNEKAKEVLRKLGKL